MNLKPTLNDLVDRLDDDSKSLVTDALARALARELNSPTELADGKTALVGERGRLYHVSVRKLLLLAITAAHSVVTETHGGVALWLAVLAALGAFTGVATRLRLDQGRVCELLHDNGTLGPGDKRSLAWTQAVKLASDTFGMTEADLKSAVDGLVDLGCVDHDQSGLHLLDLVVLEDR